MNQHSSNVRADKKAEAARMGIDEALITRLVHRFYDAVQADELLGPIFGAHIHDWPVHLGRMVDFWSSIAIEAGRFRGNPMVKHIAIPAIKPSDFVTWLGLWSEAVDATVPGTEARAYFKSTAARIADSLSMGISIHRDGHIPSAGQNFSHQQPA